MLVALEALSSFTRASASVDVGRLGWFRAVLFTMLPRRIV